MNAYAAYAKTALSSADLPAENRLEAWREHYGRRVLRIDIEPLSGVPFDAAVVSRALPNLHLLSGAVSAARISRTREFLGDGNDDVALVINRAGRVAASAPGRAIMLAPDDAVLIRSSEPSMFERPVAGRSFTIRLPCSVLSALIADPGDMFMRPIAATGALKLLASYAEALLDDDALAAPGIVPLAVTHVHDLVALALGATREAADVAGNRGVRAARLRAAKACIAERCNDPALSVGTLACRLGVTPRYVQRLFETDGTTFSAYLRAERLSRAYRLLTSPALASRQIGAIAYEVGFGDLSYFNRCFRQRYGATPRDVREAASG